MLKNYEFIELSCFAISVSKVTGSIQQILGRTDFAQFEKTGGHLSLERIYSNAPPRGGMHPIKCVVYAPASAPDTAVFIANLEDGWATMVNCVSEELGPILVAKVATSSRGVDSPFNKFEILKSGEPLRVVMAYKDDREWRFFEKGTVQKCERVEYYKRHRIGDRLTREIIVEYLSRFDKGWNMMTDSFWKSAGECTYFEQCDG